MGLSNLMLSTYRHALLLAWLLSSVAFTPAASGASPLGKDRRVFSGFAQAQLTSDTIDLQCVNQVAGGNNLLTWDMPPAPCPGFAGYIVMASNAAAGPFLPVDTLTQPTDTTYSHVNVNAPGLIWYYYIVQDCGGVLSVPSDTVDNQPPARPVVETVTIVNGSPLVIWQPGASPETDAYIVYIENPPGSGADVALDTVFNDTTYMDPNSSVDSRPERYRVTAMDACGEEGLRSSPHKTIWLRYTLDRCTRRMDLTWSLYEGWPGIDRQEIWVSRNGGAPVPFDTLGAAATNYTFIADDGDTLCLHVRAWRADNRYYSESNVVCVIANVVQPVLFSFIRNASVNPAGGVDVDWIWDADADIMSANLESQQPGGGGFSSVSVLSQPYVSPDNYTDPTTAYNNGSVRYRLHSFDSCSNEVVSQELGTLHLTAGPSLGYINQLNWAPFQHPTGTVLEYEVYRTVAGNTTLLATVPGLTTNLQDPVDPNNDDEFEVCYHLVAVTEIVLPDGGMDTIRSRSNEACASQETVLWAPNAFSPGTANGSFRIVGVYGQSGAFFLEIFDRWGAQVYQSTDILEGWDGNVRGGSEAAPGTYVWHFTFVSPEGKRIEEKGTVILVK